MAKTRKKIMQDLANNKLESRMQSIIGFYSARDYVMANTTKAGKPRKHEHPYNLGSDTLCALKISKGTEAEKKAYWLATLRKYPEVDFDCTERNWQVKYWRNNGKYNG